MSVKKRKEKYCLKRKKFTSLQGYSVPAMAQEATGTVVSGLSLQSAEKEYAGVKISLENCLFPHESIRETPSQKDGLEKEVEADLRRIGCEFIQKSGIMLKVSQVAMATAQVLFQRFFFAKSFVKHKMEEIAMACIWLATKVEECPRRVRDVINVFHFLRLKRNKLPITPMVLDQNYVYLKNNVIKAERRVLKELGFCVHVKHPHKIIVVYLQVLEMEKNRELVQTAWNYMNDSLQTTVFVQYPPETIACACIYLAARVLQISLPTHNHWFYLFNATEDDIQNICITLLSVYQTVKTPYESLEKKVEDCRAIMQQEKMKAKGSLNVAENANSPVTVSRSGSPFSNSPQKESKGQSITDPTVLESSSLSAANGDNDKNAENYDLSKGTYGNGVKRSRTRSRSNSRLNKYRSKQPSEYSSSSDNSSLECDSNIKDQQRGRSSDLPKSYSDQNSIRDGGKQRHRRRKEDEKSRHSKSRRRTEKDLHRSRGHSRSRRGGSSSKKHKRKLSPTETSPAIHFPHANGGKVSSMSPTSKKYHRHRSHHDPNRKKKIRRSLSSSRSYSSSKR